MPSTPGTPRVLGASPSSRPLSLYIHTKYTKVFPSLSQEPGRLCSQSDSRTSRMTARFDWPWPENDVIQSPTHHHPWDGGHGDQQP